MAQVPVTDMGDTLSIEESHHGVKLMFRGPRAANWVNIFVNISSYNRFDSRLVYSLFMITYYFGSHIISRLGIKPNDAHLASVLKSDRKNMQHSVRKHLQFQYQATGAGRT